MKNIVKLRTLPSAQNSFLYPFVFVSEDDMFRDQCPNLRFSFLFYTLSTHYKFIM